MKPVLICFALLSLNVFADKTTVVVNSSPLLLAQLVSDAQAIPIDTTQEYESLVAHPTPQLRELKLNLLAYLRTTGADIVQLKEQLRKVEETKIASNPLLEQLMMEIAVTMFTHPKNAQDCRTAYTAVSLLEMFDFGDKRIGIDNFTNIYFLSEISLLSHNLNEDRFTCETDSDLRIYILGAAHWALVNILGQFPNTRVIDKIPGRFDIFGEWVNGFAADLSETETATYISTFKMGFNRFDEVRSGYYQNGKLLLSYGQARDKYAARWKEQIQ